MAVKKEPGKKSDKKGRDDIFQKAYDTVTDIVQKSVNIIQTKFDEMMHELQKRAFFYLMTGIAGFFFLFAIAEFIGNAYPWYGRTIGYLAVTIIIGILALFFKKGMD